MVGLLFAFVGTELTFGEGRSGFAALLFLATLPFWILAGKLFGLYEGASPGAVRSSVDESVPVFHLVTLGVWLFYASSWITGIAMPSARTLVTFWFLAFASVMLARSAARGIARRQPAYVQNAIIVGAGEVGQLIARKLYQHPEYAIKLVGFVDSEPKEPRRDLEEFRLLGPVEGLPTLVRDHDVDRVIVAFSQERHDQLMPLLRSLHDRDIQIDVVPRLFEVINPQVGIHTLEGLPLLGLPPARMPRSSRIIKRSLDLAGAAILIALFAPLLGVIALLIKCDSRGPVLFRQKRLGMNMREFTLLKFRTMHDGTDPEPHRDYISQIMDSRAEVGSNNMYKLDRADDLTPVGRWLRKTSLDELPQFINVIRGDMSLVGPRPCIPYELEFFEPHHFERFLVPAGLTGLWQVEARAHATFAEALDLDAAYARGWSFGLDLRLLARTPAVMLRSRETG
jgi:exopolysaccharide biosynthesis polyprenyl glycosylphosphotransferase